MLSRVDLEKSVITSGPNFCFMIFYSMEAETKIQIPATESQLSDGIYFSSPTIYLRDNTDVYTNGTKSRADTLITNSSSGAQFTLDFS